MRKNVQKIVKAFINGDAAYDGALRTDGREIFSYAMKIAETASGLSAAQSKKILVLDKSKSPSNTTSSHIKGVLQGLTDAGYDVEVVDKFE